MNSRFIAAQAFLDQTNAEIELKAKEKPEVFEDLMEALARAMECDEAYREFIEDFFLADVEIGRNFLCLIGSKIGEAYLKGKQDDNGSP